MRKILFLIVFLNYLNLQAQVSVERNLWNVDRKFHKAFIENTGQFDNQYQLKSPVFCGSLNSPEKIFFTPKGLVYKIDVIISHEQEGVKKEQKNIFSEEEEEEKHGKIKTQSYYVEMNWLNSNPFPQMELSEESVGRFICDHNQKNPARGFQKLTYKNIYPNIDVVYTFPKDKDGIEYAFVLHPGANPDNIRISYTGDGLKFSKSNDGNVTIKTKGFDITEHAPLSYYASDNSNGKNSKDEYSVNKKYISSYLDLTNNIIQFKFPNGCDAGKEIIIDPWVSTSLASISVGYDVDYDNMGNLYVYGSNASQDIIIEKYSFSGTFLWQYTDYYFNSSSGLRYPGNFVVEKNSQKIYYGYGYDVGTKVFRLKQDGTIDNFNSVVNIRFEEIWDMGFDCATGNVYAMGGGTTSNLNGALVDTTSGFLTLANFTNSSNIGGEDIVSTCIDNSGAIFTLLVDYPFYQDNSLFKLNNTFNGNVWTVPTTYFSFNELSNKPYSTFLYVGTYNSNGYNALAVNDNYLFYCDGINLVAYNKNNGSKIGSTTYGNTKLVKGGIAVDDCNNIYVGDNGAIKVYKFTGTNFTSLTSIPLGGTHASDIVYDIKLDRNTGILYATGSNFVGTYSSNQCNALNSVTASAVCGSPNSVSATVNTNLNISSISYTWYNSSGMIVGQTSNTTNTSNTLNGLPNDIYSVRVQINAPCGPEVIDTAKLSCCVIIASNSSICSGGSVSLTASGASSYSWSPSTGLNTTTGSTVIASPLVTTIYTVTGPSGGCVGTTTSTVTVFPALNINCSPDSIIICSGSSINLTASGATTYIWSPAIGLNTTNGSSVIANPSLTTEYTIIGFSGICTDTSKVIIEVSPPLNIITSPASPTICSGDSLILTSAGANSFSWSPAVRLITSNGSNVIANPSGTTIYTVTGTSGSCSSATTIIVTVDPQVNVIVSPATATLCSGDSISLNAFGASSYSWSPSIAISNTIGSSVNVSPTNSIVYIVSGKTGVCTDTSSVTISVAAPLDVSVFPNSSTLCHGESVILTASGADNYLWSPSTGLNSSTGANVVVGPTATTIYTVIGTTGGCSDISTVRITIAPTLNVSVSPSATSICQGDFTILTASGATNYTWSPSIGLSSTIGSSVSANPSSTSVYTIIGISGTCTASTTAIINVNPPLNVTVSSITSILCPEDFTILTAAGAQSYEWSPAENLSASTGASVTAFPLKTTTYTVIGTTANCRGEAYTTIKVINSPVVNLGGDIIIRPGDLITLVAPGNGSYLWNTGQTTFSIAVNPVENTLYFVTVTDPLGCVSSDSIFIEVDFCNDLFVPNAFTPDGDGVNDLFYPASACTFESFNFLIFNRWGEVIFESEDNMKKWDGKFKGGLCEEAVYVYTIDYKFREGDSKNKRGTVTLMRLK